MAQDAGNSTFYAQIHSMFDVAQGLIQGGQIGQQVVKHAQSRRRTVKERIDNHYAETTTLWNTRIRVRRLVRRREQIRSAQSGFGHRGDGGPSRPCLINPWGIVASPTSPFWVSLNGAGLSALYDGNGNAEALIVGVPGPAGTTTPGQQCRTTRIRPGRPVGHHRQRHYVFPVGGTPASFIFSSEQGVIAGWNGAAGKIRRDHGGPVRGRRGLQRPRDRHPLGRPAALRRRFRQRQGGRLRRTDELAVAARSFHRPTIPAGFAPFNIPNLGGSLYVTYAKQNAEHHDDVARRWKRLRRRLRSQRPSAAEAGFGRAAEFAVGYGDRARRVRRLRRGAPGGQFWRRCDQRVRSGERKVPRRAAGWHGCRDSYLRACGGSRSETEAAPIPAPRLPAAMPIRSTLRPASRGRIRSSRMGCWEAFNLLPRLPATAWSIPRVSCLRSRRERSPRSSATDSQQPRAVGRRPNWPMANCPCNVSFPQGCMKSARRSW